MKITKIEYTLGITVNLGNYENLRPEITIKAEADELQPLETQHDIIQTQAKTELALSLWDQATQDLEDVRFLAVDEDRHMSRARTNSSAFRWICKLNPDVATDLLNGIVEDQRIEAEREAARKAAEAAATEALLDIGPTAEAEPDQDTDGFDEETELDEDEAFDESFEVDEESDEDDLDEEDEDEPAEEEEADGEEDEIEQPVSQTG